MIHIVEINEQNHARVWFAFDEADFIRKVQATADPLSSLVIFEQTTPALLMQDSDNPTEANALATAFGAETAIYRADYLLSPGAYQTEPISALQASLAVVASAADFRVYTNDEDAADELDRDPLYQSKEGFEAAIKLRTQLVEMEVLAEDF